MLQVLIAVCLVLVQTAASVDEAKKQGFTVQAKDISLILPPGLHLFLPLADGGPAVLANFADYYEGAAVPADSMKITISVEDKKSPKSLDDLVKAETQNTRIDKSTAFVAGQKAIKVVVVRNDDDRYIGEVSSVVYLEHRNSIYKFSLTTRWLDRDRREFTDCFERMLKSVSLR